MNGGAATLPLRFQVGARTLASIPRRLVRVALSLEDVLAGTVPPLAAPEPGSDGYLLTSLPADRIGDVGRTGLLVQVRQRYVRHFVDLSTGQAGWEAGLSGSTRSSLKRKEKKLASADGGAIDIREYKTPDEVVAFFPLARAVSATTYQERLLDAGLPDDPAPLLRLAAADRLRGWLLFADGRPIAYLCCTAEGTTLRYDYVGHDPAASSWSPGAVLQARALRDLFGENRFRWFDFTEGEGQHKRALATGGIACVDLLLLRPTPANRASLAALSAFDGAVRWAKRVGTSPALAGIARRVRR